MIIFFYKYTFINNTYWLFMNTKGFTLVELVIIATILIILWVVGVIMFQRNLTDVRDTTRIVDLKNIYESMNSYTWRNNIWLYPNNGITLKKSTLAVAYQWELSQNIADQIQIDGNITDPLTGEYYNFFIDKNFNNLQFLWYLENPEYTNNIFDNFEFFPYFQWSDNGAFFIDKFTEKSAHYDWEDVDISSVWNDYFVVLNNSEIISSSESLTQNIDIILDTGIHFSCNELLSNNKNLKGKNGVYIVKQWQNYVEVYCDMTTDWGWWTVSTMHDGTWVNLFNTNNQNKITSLNQNISSAWNISNFWDDIDTRDILLQCFTSSSQHQWYTRALIIYDYEKSDIDFLLNDEKRWAKFSSKILKAKWWDKNLYLSPDYGTNGDIYSFELYQSDAQWNIGSWVFEMTNGTSLKASSSAYLYSPAYRLSGWSVYQWLNQTNYCISAIR